MRAILYLLPLSLFCLGWFIQSAPDFTLYTGTTFLRGNAPSVGSSGREIPDNLDGTAGGLARVSQFRSSQSPSATPTPVTGEISVKDAPSATDSEAVEFSTDWQAFEDLANDLTIYYPREWHFFDGTQTEALQQEMGALGRAEIVKLLIELQSTVQPSSFIGAGFAFPPDPPDLLHANSVIVEIFPARGLALYEFGQGAAAALDRQIGIDVDSFDLVTRLRPNREEAVSIRFRGAVPVPTTSQSILTGTRTTGWQVILLSPDAEYLLVLTFSVLGEMFEELEPLLSEMVRRVQWAGDHGGTDPGFGPATISSRTMYVHNEPALYSPIIGKIDAGKQFSIMERDFTGNWWRISYCLLYTSPSPRDGLLSRMPSSA